MQPSGNYLYYCLLGGGVLIIIILYSAPKPYITNMGSSMGHFGGLVGLGFLEGFLCVFRLGLGFL